jgi:hypothetical protein
MKRKARNKVTGHPKIGRKRGYELLIYEMKKLVRKLAKIDIFVVYCRR